MPSKIKFQNLKLQALFKDAQSKTYTLLGVSILLVVLLFLAAIRPTILKIGEIQNQIKDVRNTKNDLDSKLKVLTKLDQQYRDYETIIPVFQDSIPNKVDTAALTANISELARLNNLTLQSIQYSSNVYSTGSSITTPADFDTTKISLSIKVNNYTDLASFIKQIEKYPRPMHIDKISISSPQEATGSKKVTDTRLSISLDILTIQKKGTK
jgi:Tfp pilus assembly protein PilO